MIFCFIGSDTEHMGVKWIPSKPTHTVKPQILNPLLNRRSPILDLDKLQMPPCLTGTCALAAIVKA